MIAFLQSNLFSTLSTDDEDDNAGKENERESNKIFHSLIDDDVYKEIMNCLRYKLMIKF